MKIIGSKRIPWRYGAEGIVHMNFFFLYHDLNFYLKNCKHPEALNRVGKGWEGIRTVSFWASWAGDTHSCEFSDWKILSCLSLPAVPHHDVLPTFKCPLHLVYCFFLSCFLFCIIVINFFLPERLQKVSHWSSNSILPLLQSIPKTTITRFSQSRDSACCVLDWTSSTMAHSCQTEIHFHAVELDTPSISTKVAHSVSVYTGILLKISFSKKVSRMVSSTQLVLK